MAKLRLETVGLGLQRVFRYFPVEALIALAGSVAAVLMITGDHQLVPDSIPSRMVLSCLVALPFALAANLYVRYLQPPRWARVAVGLCVALIAGLYFFLVTPQAETYTFYCTAALLVAGHAAVAVAGFLRKGRLGAFWQFNRILFLRIITAGIFSGVLFLGLAGALAASDALFGLRIKGETYGCLFALIAGVFNTWFFLAGVPAEEETLRAEAPYPQVLKIFVQYVLLPLVLTYLLILLAYEAKIIADGRLPHGWVSNLILSYGVAGILALLLLWPIRNDSDKPWIRLFSKGFYFLLLPLLVLLFVAIWKRIGAYGFTEERYFVFALALWLSGIALYFLARGPQRADIRVIPASLAVLAFLTIVGPLSAGQISLRSQRARLVHLLQQEGGWKNGMATRVAKEPDFEGRKSISSTLEYLVETHGLKGLKGILPAPMLSSVDTLDAAYYQTTALTDSLGVTYTSRWQQPDEPYLVLSSFSSTGAASIPVRGYDYVLTLDRPGVRADDSTNNGESGFWLIQINGRKTLQVMRGSTPMTSPIHVDSFLLKLNEKYRSVQDDTPIKVAPEVLQLDGESLYVHYRLVFTEINGYYSSKRGVDDMYYSGILLLKLKQ